MDLCPFTTEENNPEPSSSDSEIDFWFILCPSGQLEQLIANIVESLRLFIPSVGYI